MKIGFDRRLASSPHRWTVSVLGLALAACSAADSDSRTGVSSGGALTTGGASQVATGGLVSLPEAAVKVRYALGEGATGEFGEVPYPDDSFRDAAGAVRGGAAWAETAFAEAMHDSLASLDGFGVQGPVWFELDGDLDPDSMPQSAAESVKDDAAAFLMDVDTNSPTAYQRVPVTLTWDAERRRLRMQPAPGTVLAPRRRYAAVLTTGLRDEAGDAIGASPDFRAVRDAGGPLEMAPFEAARSAYAPILDALSPRGVGRSDVVGLAVFRVQSVVGEMEEALDRVRSTASGGVTISAEVAAAELDALLGSSDGQLGLTATGVSHANLASVVQANLDTPVLLSKTAFVHGAFERDDTGALEVQRISGVPFSIFVPRQADPDRALGVVFFLHGAGGDRGDALAMADRFAAANLAVIALDAPFHGQRERTGDMVNRFTGEPTPDGFGDGGGDFYGTSDDAGSLVQGHPFYYRDALRQWALEHIHALDVARMGGFDGLGLPTLDFSRVAFVGLDAGADVALMVSALADGVETVVALSSGSPTVHSWLGSPAQSERMAAMLSQLDVPASRDAAPRSPLTAWLQMLLDRSDPMAWSGAINRRAVNLLLLSFDDDQAVGVGGTEVLAQALGAAAAGGEEAKPFAEGVTRAYVPLPTGAHNSLLSALGERLFEPLEDGLPAARLATPEAVDNPIAEAQRQVLRFVESWRACVDTGATAPCRAQLATAP